MGQHRTTYRPAPTTGRAGRNILIAIIALELYLLVWGSVLVWWPA